MNIAAKGWSEIKAAAVQENPNHLAVSGIAVTTMISYDLPAASYVTCTMYDAQSVVVMHFFNHLLMPAGSHEISYDASNLASGVYLYTFTAVKAQGPAGQSYSTTKRMLLIK